MTERLRDLSWCLCHYCGTEAAGAYRWAPKGGVPKVTCPSCWETRQYAWREQVRRKEIDEQARDDAGAAGGAYLESIQVTDFAVLTPDQYVRFLDTIFRARVTALRRAYALEAPPL